MYQNLCCTSKLHAIFLQFGCVCGTHKSVCTHLCVHCGDTKSTLASSSSPLHIFLFIHSFVWLFIYLSVCLLFGVWVFYLYVYLYNTTFRVQVGQKKASDTLELEPQTVISLHVGSRNQTQVLLENIWCSFSCWVISHAPTLCFETCISLNMELAI